EHTCMSALPPRMRADYRRGIDPTPRRGGLLVGGWFINPALDPGGEGPPHPLRVADLTAPFSGGCPIVDDLLPSGAFPARAAADRVMTCASRREPLMLTAICTDTQTMSNKCAALDAAMTPLPHSEHHRA